MIREELFAMREPEYAEFQRRLIPNIPPATIVGVRVPKIRALAKRVSRTMEAEAFLDELPHKTFDENLLHGMLVAEMKDFDRCLEAVDRFLPFIDNWAVCDTLSPKVFKKGKERLLEKVRGWVSSEHEYTCRFGIGMLLTYFLDEDFETELLTIPASISSDAFYVRMMISWFFATALAKQWDATIPYITENRLAPWILNKTIQKAIESRRISDERKAFLREFKRKPEFSKDAA